MRFSLLFLSTFILSSCGGLSVQEVPLKNPIESPFDAQPAPIGFNKIVFSIPTGEATVSNSPKGFLGFFECQRPYGLTSQGSIRGRSFPSENLREIFFQTMEGEGYDVTGNPGRLFNEVEDYQRSIYSVGGRITDIKIDTCRQMSFWGIEQGRRGEGHVEVEWSVYDLLSRKTVFKTKTKGYSELKHANYEGITLLFEDAVAAAIYNLSAHQDFHDLVFHGELPKKQPKNYDDPFEKPLGLFDPNETVSIHPQKLFTTSTKGRLEDITKTAVLIQKAGHGSGFFLTQQGHILTNAHVVGNADRMRIVTHAKKHKLVAEVLRVDRRRDVALLKLETIPDNFKIQTLPLRTETPKVGSDVYAIGTPSYTRLQDTVTKGIVSANRYNPIEKQHYIQADVTIHGGNSGGPLIDQNGNIIGLAVSGYIRGTQDLSGLNNFVPIQDALDALDINLQSTGRPLKLE